MSEVKKRKFYSSEFKAKVGLEALRGLKTINEIGQEFGVHPILSGNGRRRFKSKPRQYLKVNEVRNRSIRIESQSSYSARSAS